MKEFLKKFLYILGESKKKLFLVALLFLVVAGLDFLGIGMFIPLVSIIMSPENIQEQFLFQYVNRKVDIEVGAFSLFLCVGILVIFFLRNVLFLASNAYIFKFSFSQMAHLREKLLSSYMNLPYVWHLKQNSSRIIQNINSEANQFCNSVLLPFLKLFGQLIVLLFLLFLILQENVLFTLGLFLVLFIVFLVYFFYTKRVSSRLGKEISLSNEEIIKNIKQGLGSIKDAKVTAREDFFKENVRNEADRFAKANTKHQIINFSPTSIIELVIITYIIAWFGVYFALGFDVQSLIPLLTIVALAGLRVLPMISQIMQAVNNFHRSEFFLNKLYNDLVDLEKIGKDVASKKIKNFQRIEIKNLYFNYDEEPILKNISFAFNKNDIIGITGETGSGKTTLINVLLGLLKNNEGKIMVDGKEYSNKYLRHLMAYIPQDIFLLDDTIKRNIAFGIRDKDIDEKKVVESLKAAQVYDFVEKLPEKTEAIVGENGVRLSGGQRQRLGIARALYHDRKIFVFDEATSSLDYKTEKKVQEAIMSLKDKKTIIMIAHRLRTLGECDIIHIIKNGQIVKSGNYAEIKGYFSESAE
ncbi:MAG: ABC transporter ATP-binding protein [Candidatus Moranbacteria bacterium]|nr:ABC transporter ATP-binding protein [Candidatus Moranbacteria bacterium]